MFFIIYDYEGVWGGIDGFIKEFFKNLDLK